MDLKVKVIAVYLQKDNIMGLLDLLRSGKFLIVDTSKAVNKMFVVCVEGSDS